MGTNGVCHRCHLQRAVPGKGSTFIPDLGATWQAGFSLDLSRLDLSVMLLHALSIICGINEVGKDLRRTRDFALLPFAFIQLLGTETCSSCTDTSVTEAARWALESQVCAVDMDLWPPS